MAKRDYYEVLGVPRTADEPAMKKAFRALARELHPDVNAHDPEAEEKFKEAAEAYEVLSDSGRRRTYDAYGHDGLRSGGWAPTQASSLQDIFEALFSGGGDPLGFGRPRAAGGADIGAVVELELVEVLKEAHREIRAEAVSTCAHCNGNGAEPGTPIQTCERCGGRGQLQQVSRTVFGQMVHATACDACGGDGRIAEAPCGECNGAGRVIGERTWDVDVPAGIEDGQRIRISGAGHAGDSGGRSGDLYVEVRVRSDDRFRRDGSELATTVEVPVTAAMLGARVSVPTLEGEHEIEIPAGTQPGDVIKLAKQGLPALNGRRRGHLNVVIRVVVPESLDAGQRKLAEQLDQALGGSANGAAPSGSSGGERGSRRKSKSRRR